MTGFRQLHTKIWSDKWFGGLPPDFKLLYIYLFGNDKSSMSGIYELPLRIIEFETGLKHNLILDILADFVNAGKIEYDYNAEVIWIKNMRKYQGNNKSWQVQERIKKDIDGVPDCDLKKKYIEEEVVVIPDTASMPHGGSSDALITSTSIDTSIDIVKSIDSEGEGVGGGTTAPADCDEPCLSPLSTAFVNATKIPELTGGPPRWIDALERMQKAGVEPIDVTNAVQELRERDYSITTLSSIVNPAISAMSKRKTGGKKKHPDGCECDTCLRAYAAWEDA